MLVTRLLAGLVVFANFIGIIYYCFKTCYYCDEFCVKITAEQDESKIIGPKIQLECHLNKAQVFMNKK